MARIKTIDYYLKTAWQSVANSYNYTASQVGLTQATGYVLINIRKEGTAVSQLASQLGVRSTSLSRLLSTMEKEGLIYREASEVDKRSVKIYLTESGIEKRAMAKEMVRDFNDYLVQNMSDTERARLEDLLVKINQLSQRFMEEKKIKGNNYE